jgi:hypothetical protein
MLLALVLISAASCQCGCGVQGAPHPPRLEVPARITDLAAVEIGQSVELRFTIPQLSTDEQRLTKPLEFEILRSLRPEQQGMAQLPEPEVWTRLAAKELEPYTQKGEAAYPVHLTEQEFRNWRGHTLVVGVRTLTRGFRHRAIESAPSNLVEVPIYDISQPVGGVNCVTTEKAIEVRFATPSEMLSGQPVHGLAGYRIYRSSTGESSSFAMIGETPGSPYRDAQFEFGHTYYYKVRAVFGEKEPRAMSDDSQPEKVVPRDTFPPAPPQALTGIFSGGGVELIWTANTETDLAGYNVYRVGTEGPPQRLNKELLRTPIFRDTNETAGQTLTYYATAVDLSGNESKPSAKVIVETQ